MRKLIVSNLPPDTTETDLIELFEEFGVEAVTLTDYYAVLVFGSDAGAYSALQEWNNTPWGGSMLRVKIAKW